MTFDPFLTLPNLAALLIAIAGAFVRGYSGFGNGLVMAPLLTILWGPVEAIATTVALGLIASFQLIPPAVKTANWRDAGPMAIATIVIAPVGTFFLINLDPEIVKNIIAGMVLLVSLITLRGWTYKGPRGWLPSSIAGSIGAFVNGIAAVGGPPVVLYLMAMPDIPRVQRANIIIILGVTSLMIMLALLFAGEITSRVLINAALLTPPTFMAVWAGSKLFEILPGHVFRLVILWFLVAISITILVV
ncbi:MAG: sulfite exporter TauE/SafE family protein [Rhodospirillales bacterium]|nr:sulfite exporter TauE/SafE family protein [Rhodospirillales bacterium]